MNCTSVFTFVSASCELRSSISLLGAVGFGGAVGRIISRFMPGGCHVIEFLFALQVALIEYISYSKRQKGIIFFSLSWSDDSFLLCFLYRDKQLQ